MKKSVASTAVVRDRKFAEPVAPNRLPEAPPPKPEPMSAPLPCWSSTSPMIASAISTCSTTIRLVQSIASASFLCRGARDGEEVPRRQRCTAYQSAVHVRHAEDRRRVLRLHAAAVQDRRFGRHVPPEQRVHRLRLLRRRGAPGTDRPHRLVGQHRARKLVLVHH